MEPKPSETIPADTKQNKTDTPKTQDTRKASIKEELTPIDELKPLETKPTEQRKESLKDEANPDLRKGSIDETKPNGPFGRRQSAKVRILI